ncbi:hypothetical protein D3C84_378680 [compost metagenome]
MLDAVEQVEQADDDHKAGVLEQGNEGVDDARDHQLQGLRQDHQAHAAPIAKAHGGGGFVLALGDGLQAATHHFGDISRLEQDHPDQCTQQLVEAHAFGQEQRQHHRRHEQHGNQRHAPPELDEGHADHTNRRHLRTAPQCQQDAQRQGAGNTHGSDHQGQHQAAPLAGRHHVQAQVTPMQQGVGQDRVDHQETQPVDGLAREAIDEQRRRADDCQPYGQVHAPAQYRWVVAVHELTEALLDEHPAGAFLGAVGPGGTDPVGVDDRPLQQRRHDQKDQVDREHCQQGIQPAGEQMRAHPAQRAHAGLRSGHIRFENMSRHARFLTARSAQCACCTSSSAEKC